MSKETEYRKLKCVVFLQSYKVFDSVSDSVTS